MAPRDREPDDLEPLDLDDVDLEVVDLEVVDPSSGAGGAHFDDTVDRKRRPWIWIGLVGAALAAWAAIGLTGSARHSHSTAHPAATASTTSIPAPRVDRITALEPLLRTNLRGVGSGRFAIIVDDRLYLLDTTTAHLQAQLIPLPEGHVTIDDRSGPSLLATTYQQTLVSTQPLATRTLSPQDTAIRGISPTPWVLLRSDGTIRDERGNVIATEPPGLRVVGEVDGGFVATDAPDERWVLWSGTSMRTIAPPGYQLVATGPGVILFRHDCGYGGCALETLDVGRGTLTAIPSMVIPQFAAFSPDGTRLALQSTLGDVLLLDAQSGAEIADAPGVNGPIPALPFTWTPDSRTLVVVGRNHIEVLRASDGALTSDINGTDDLQQLVALP